MNVEQVIGLLADGKVHSGEELGQAMGVSRTAVWKQLKKLEAMGLSLVTVKGRGYQLQNGLELLGESHVYEHLAPSAQGLINQFEIHGSIDSTNSRVLQQAELGLGHGYVCLAEHQSAGRGRRGRQWVSPYGRNIYLSLGWEFPDGAAALEGLSLAVGVAIVRALLDNGLTEVELKWPNDVLWQGKKLAGVLLEMTGDAAGPCQVVIGVGLNVHMLDTEAQDIDQQWISLAALPEPISRNQLAAGLINELLPLLADYQHLGFAPLRQEWERYDSFRQREVEVRTGDQLTVGRVMGVSDDGALRLITERGEELIYGGEASLRQAQ